MQLTDDVVHLRTCHSNKVRNEQCFHHYETACSIVMSQPFHQCRWPGNLKAVKALLVVSSLERDPTLDLGRLKVKKSRKTRKFYQITCAHARKSLNTYRIDCKRSQLWNCGQFTVIDHLRVPTGFRLRGIGGVINFVTLFLIKIICYVIDSMIWIQWKTLHWFDHSGFQEAAKLRPSLRMTAVELQCSLEQIPSLKW